MTPAQFRKAALALEGVEEQSHMNHPDFRVHGKIFAGMNEAETEATLKLTPEIQATLEDEALSPAAGAWGQKGWTKVHLATAPLALVKTLLREAWSTVPAPKPKAKRAGATASGAGRSRRRPSSR